MYWPIHCTLSGTNPGGEKFEKILEFKMQLDEARK